MIHVSKENIPFISSTIQKFTNEIKNYSAKEINRFVMGISYIYETHGRREDEWEAKLGADFIQNFYKMKWAINRLDVHTSNKKLNTFRRDMIEKLDYGRFDYRKLSTVHRCQQVMAVLDPHLEHIADKNMVAWEFNDDKSDSDFSYWNVYIHKDYLIYSFTYETLLDHLRRMKLKIFLHYNDYIYIEDTGLKKIEYSQDNGLKTSGYPVESDCLFNYL